MAKRGTAAKAEAGLPASAHLMCGWPLFLVVIGGAIGGGLGGAAYGINMAVYKSQWPIPIKIAFNLLTGLAAIGIWVAIVIALQQGQS